MSPRALRSAAIVAETVAVLCPHCGAEQPSPYNGGDCWTPAEVRKAAGPRACVSCDERFRLVPHARAAVAS